MTLGSLFCKKRRQSLDIILKSCYHFFVIERPAPPLSGAAGSKTGGITMKRTAVRLLAVVLALVLASSALLTGFAQEDPLAKELAYTFNGVQYLCAASAARDDNEEEEGYDLTFVFDTVPNAITAHLTEACFSLDNSQPGMEHVYRQEIWNVFTDYMFELYNTVFGKEMFGRSPEGATRELQMHCWMFRMGDAVQRMVKPIDLLLGKVPPFSRLFGLFHTVLNRARVTELGPTDGSDHNGYVFEEADSDLQALLRYGLDFLSLDFMNGLFERTQNMEFDALDRIDQLLFHPNELEKLAERQYVNKQNNNTAPFPC